MHKLKELEDKWFHYKVKKIIIPAIKVSSLYLLLVGSYYVYDNKSDLLMSLLPSNGMTNVLGVSMESNDSIVEKVLPLEKTLISKKEEIIKKEEVVKKEVMEESKVVEKISLGPIIPVIDMEKEERISSTVKKYRPVKKHRTVRKVKNTVKAKQNTYLTAKELAVMSKSKTKDTLKKDSFAPRKTKKMNFTSSSSNYIETMKQKFSKSNTARDALLLAKTYYKNAQYAEAEKWALSANKLNNSLEDSWLLFAKSKAKLAKKREALKILVSYYKKSNSVKAKKLIMQIKSGRI